MQITLTPSVLNSTYPRWLATDFQPIVHCRLPKHDCLLTAYHSLSLPVSASHWQATDLQLVQLQISTHTCMWISTATLPQLTRCSNFVCSPLHSSRSQSYVTTDCQSSSLSWCQAPIWGPGPDFVTSRQIEGLLIWGAFSETRLGLLFTITAGPRQRSYSRVRVPRGSWPYFTLSDLRFPQPGGQGPRIYIPQKKGVPLISPGTGFSFRRLLRLAGIRWRYSTSPPYVVPLHSLFEFFLYNFVTYRAKQPFLIVSPTTVAAVA
jgi:hypothetical protein